MAYIGYARVSTHDQNLQLQKDALERSGCQRVFQDHISGSTESRPGLDQAMDYLREGDTLVVWRLDRLGRSLRHLIDFVSELRERGIGFKSLTESIDTTTSNGKLIFNIFASLAEFERELIRERTQAGLKAARARGRLGGRPRVMDDVKVKMAKSLLDDHGVSVREVCQRLGVSRPTLYRYLKHSAA